MQERWFWAARMLTYPAVQTALVAVFVLAVIGLNIVFMADTFIPRTASPNIFRYAFAPLLSGDA